MIKEGICKNFKLDIASGVHNPNHVYKMALYTSGANLNENTDKYSTASEADGRGYTKGGRVLEGLKIALANSGTVIWDWEIDPMWVASTITARGGLIYNDSVPGKNSICVIDFVVDYSSNNGPFTYIFPDPTESEALIRIK